MGVRLSTRDGLAVQAEQISLRLELTSKDDGIVRSSSQGPGSLKWILHMVGGRKKQVKLQLSLSECKEKDRK